jgi:hypothetical protein
MCGKSFKKVDYIDYKIIAFEVNKRVFFLHHAKHGQQTLNALGLKLLYYTKLRLLILRWKIELKIHKKIKLKNLFFCSLKGHSVGGHMC